MKQIWKLLTPQKDDDMLEYLTLVLKPFNIFDPKVLGVGLLSAITAITTYLSYVSTTYLGISIRFSAMLGVLVIGDHVSGTLAAINNQIPITSKIGRRTLYKSGAYIFFIYIGYNLHTEIQQTDTLFIEVLKYFHPYLLIHITFWELFSIDENLKKLGLNFGISDFLKKTYNKLTSIFDNVGKTKEE